MAKLFSAYAASPAHGNLDATPLGTWISESGSLYPTLDVTNLVDVISDNLRSKVSTLTGYRDAEAQVPHLTRLCRQAGALTPTMNYSDFSHVLSTLNVIGLQHGVSAFFDRYDYDGTGVVVLEQFIAMVLRCVPDGNGTLALRNAFAIIRRALRAAAGVHGVRAAVAHLMARSRDGVLARGDLDEVLVSMGAYAKEADVRPVLVEFDRERTGRISLPELVAGLRGCLPRGRRLLVDRLWQSICPGGASMGVAELVAAMNARSAFLSDGAEPTLVAAELRELVSLGGATQRISAADFVEYAKDLSAVLTRDSEFCGYLQEVFGLDTAVDRCSLIKPGSIEAVLRAGTCPRGLPDSSTAGRRPVEGLLGDGGAAAAATSRFALDSDTRLAASLGGRMPVGAAGARASVAALADTRGGGGHAAVLAPQLARSLGAESLRM